MEIAISKSDLDAYFQVVALHTAFAPQRVNANREFFRIAPEQAIAILELFQHEDVTAEVSQEIENDLTPEDKAAQEKSRTKRPPLHFLDMGLHEGDVLVFKPDETITCIVIDQKHVQYNGIVTTLTPITTELLGKSYSVQPTPYSSTLLCKKIRKMCNTRFADFSLFYSQNLHQNEITHHHYRSLGDNARSLHTEDRNETIQRHEHIDILIGNSYLALLDPASGLCNVSFEPGCRNNWHVHHGAVQMLICVSGRGWYQEWGKEPVELKPGVVVAVPEGVKHWHGAAADSWMQHLTYHANVQPGNSNEWLEPVDDEWYGKLK